MRSGMRRPPGATSLMLLRILNVGASYPDIVRQTSGDVLGICGAPEGYRRESRMHGGYKA